MRARVEPLLHGLEVGGVDAARRRLLGRELAQDLRRLADVSEACSTSWAMCGVTIQPPLAIIA